MAFGTCAVFVAASLALKLPLAPAPRLARSLSSQMGLFDAFKNAFENKDFGTKPAMCVPPLIPQAAGLRVRDARGH